MQKICYIDLSSPVQQRVSALLFSKYGTTYCFYREKGATIVSKRVDDFRERSQPQLGKVHDP